MYIKTQLKKKLKWIHKFQKELNNRYWFSNKRKRTIKKKDRSYKSLTNPNE